MAISFPSSPSTGQKFTHGNKVWTWDGNSWKGGVSSGGDAGTLDSLNSTQFLRSDTDTSTTGKLGIGTTSPSQKLDVAGTTKAEQYLLDAIAKDISDTAVDVFVYDTRKDSDGGAWRKRTEYTSWYNETLNTATRGSRKEFPAVAVIVAESNQVTIYDGDDPDMPMWMVFNSGDTSSGHTYFEFWATSSSAATRTVFALNGLLAVGVNGSVYSGMASANFIDDSGYQKRAYGNQTVNMSYPISGRFIKNTSGYVNSGGIVNAYVNDIVMTVLPNAPIDTSTGLPVPTIAVATNGGTSLIKDDGSVVDILNRSNNRTMRVAFDRQGRLFIHDAHPAVSGYGAVVQFNTLPSGDVTTTSNYHADGDVLYDANYNGWNLPRSINNNYLGFNAISAGDGELALGTYQAGFARLYYTEGGDGIAAFYGSDHASYYAPRNIKGVFLAETNTTSLTTSVELNDDVDMLDSSLWSSSADGVDWSVSGQVTITEQNGSDRSITRNIPTIIEGKYYRVEIEYTNATTSGSGNRIYFASGTYYVLQTASVPTTKVFYAKAGSGQHLGVLLSSTNATTTILRMSVKEVDFDRHRSPLGSAGGPVGLIVNGTVTKTPVATGADLVGYSGWSTSNYLEQPYNSELDFGTGDFCVMGWVKGGSVGRTVFSRGYYTGGAYVGSQIYLQSLSGNWTLRVSDDGFVSTDNISGNPVQNEWTLVAGVRSGNNLMLYENGVLTGSGSVVNAAASLDNVNGTLLVGNSHSLGGSYDGSLALLRISATAPSPEQIKKIYEDEKFLFQENAKATLYGSSDAVTALAYDDSTELLHVGTSAGRSVFRGLRRIDNTTDAVGAAISASNGMVAED